MDVDVAVQDRIDRDQVVGAVELDAVAGVVDDRHIGVARPVDKVAQRAAHLVDLEVAAILCEVSHFTG
jgi:hypothetical protein